MCRALRDAAAAVVAPVAVALRTTSHGNLLNACTVIIAGGLSALQLQQVLTAAASAAAALQSNPGTTSTPSLTRPLSLLIVAALSLTSHLRR